MSTPGIGLTVKEFKNKNKFMPIMCKNIIFNVRQFKFWMPLSTWDPLMEYFKKLNVKSSWSINVIRVLANISVEQVC